MLTTVNHLNNDVWQLTAESRSGRREQLQPTGLHKFYSETRRNWVSTKEIHAGEVIRGRAGPLTLVDAHPLPGTRRVYNLTVEGEHVYYVSELGLLAHNTCAVRHGTDLASAEDIVRNGLNRNKAESLGGNGDFFATRNAGDANFFAQANPAGGTPAILRIDLDDNVLDSLRRQNLVVEDGDVLQFQPEAFDIINEFGRFSIE